MNVGGPAYTVKDGTSCLAETSVTGGTYDITFHFAEPLGIERDQRVFAALAEGHKVIDDLDVMLFRDGKTRSALTVTVPDVVVAEAELNIHFEALLRQPVLSALQVRRRSGRDESWQPAWQDEFDNRQLDDCDA